MKPESSPSFVTCPRGLEDVVASELAQPHIAAQRIRADSSGVTFHGSKETLYRANLWLRTGIRVLGSIRRGPVGDPDELYDWASEVDWTALMSIDQTFSVEARVWDSAITHSKYAALRVKDALCDRFRERNRGRRPDVQVHGADLPLFLYIYKNQATLYRDWSGETLHKRGYRDVMHKSSLNEVVAAAMLSLAEWGPGKSLLDPMCGSGTLPIEAALAALDHAPGLFRETGGFPFERWPDFDEKLWASVRDEARRKSRRETGDDVRIAANDSHPGALSLARRDARKAGVDRFIEFSNDPISAYTPPFHPDIVTVNPPWGERLDTAELRSTWKELRLFLKECCAPSTAWVLSGSAEASKHMGLRASRKVPLQIGKVDCRVLRYDILPPRGPVTTKPSPWPQPSSPDAG